MSVKGDTVVIGSKYASGKAYVFRRLENATWRLEATLKPPDHSGYFGWSISFDNETAVTGAPFYSYNGVEESGMALVFVRSGNSWSLQANLTAGDAIFRAGFGRAVSIHGNRILVWGQGAAYLFERENDAWTEVAKLVGKLPFQPSVFVRGKTLVATSNESVTVFMRNKLDKPKAITPIGKHGDHMAQTDTFGDSVVVSDSEDIIAVTAGQLGVYFYQRNGSRWVNRSLFHTTLASSVSISGSTFVYCESSWGTDGAAYAMEVGA